ncbi:SAM-dependent methyltransferase [Candidatus Riesia pediculischaeffi]|uniref:Ribosomal RNA large subunit methyltransferase E n=1 Tax=Candidatus Riesia pediculischaeffi PTSU TaxID=1401651 RepID=A0A0C1V5W6_9ENTR|nr:SAM-dependent methyltransferase [Candidatus Riesia pediculischaeffi]KIE63794.1 Cell division protein FtsJ / Ribosomal RNA large subunit methyltransferase E [Candidatus Riesia pediculischaeffi PTSU]
MFNQKKKVRSRAWFKLYEIQKKDGVLFSGMRVVDLGSSPGGWSSYASQVAGISGKIISCDLKPMNLIKNVHFFQGDVFQESTIIRLSKSLELPAHVVLSDMCPNITGKSVVDSQRCLLLFERVIEICRSLLITGGDCVMKVFHGAKFSEQCEEIRKNFSELYIRKPRSSLKSSNEVYIVAKRFRENHGYCHKN